MKRSGAAEGDEDVIPGIAPALGRDELNGADDVRVGHAQGRVGHLLQAPAEPLRQGSQRRPRFAAVEGHAPADEGFRLQRAAQQMRVGNGRQRSAPAVAGRPRIGARGLGSDPQHAPVVDPDDGTAPRPDRRNVDNRGTHRQPVDFRLGRKVRLAAAHQAHVGAGTSHVEGDDVVEAGDTGLPNGSHHPRRRPRIETGDGAAADAVRRKTAAIRLHDREVPLEAARPQLRLQPRNIGIDDRLHVGRQRGRGRPLVLAELPGHLGRVRHEDVRMPLVDQAGNPFLVIRIGVRVEKADRDGIVGAAGEGRPHDLLRGFDIQGRDDPAVRADALPDLERVSPPDHRFWFLVEQVVDPFAVVALKQQQIAEAGGHEEGDLGALALEDGIGRHRRAVNQVFDRVEPDVRGGERRKRAFVGARRRARYLGDGDPPPVDGDEIRECAADFDSHSQLEPPCLWSIR